jgi:uncharacterized protein
VFLDKTWRLHPEICAFTSELFYEGRLNPRDECQRQWISYPGTGLWFVAASHEGNTSRSDEEADQVATLWRQLTNGAQRWTNSRGETAPLTNDDVLIVAPYNDQVNRIAERLPGARAGTVDKFQGQEAAVVIYSMTSSSPEDAPHGMEFLYNLNRLNVATSRARCACILVANPRNFAPDCRTPGQMELANALCRYRELARELVVGRAFRTGTSGRTG